jgi:tetratricopeptide (TPR) repeat protein
MAGWPSAILKNHSAILPNDPLTYPQLGRIAMSQHKYHDAEMDLQMATVLTLQNPPNFLLLGELYVEMHRLVDGEKALRKAIDKTPDPSLNHYDIQHAHYRLGRLLVDEGKVEEGEKELDVAQDMLMRSRLQDESKLEGKPAISAVLSTPRAAKPKGWRLTKHSRNRLDRSWPVATAIWGESRPPIRTMDKRQTIIEHASRWDPALK